VKSFDFPHNLIIDKLLPIIVDLSSIDDYYDTLRKTLPDSDRKEPYILRGKKK
jgi:hypothetical protein